MHLILLYGSCMSDPSAVSDGVPLKPGLPVLDLALGLLALDAVAFLDAVDQLLTLSLDLVEVVPGTASSFLRSDPSS
jgi:hypothetical protein